MALPLPPDEAGRLAALRAHDLLDTASERVFDELTAAAATACDVPTALMVLVDEQRQWFKSRTGFSAEQTPRAVAFCSHAVASGELLVVPDAARDARFQANPLVVGPPFIRFYAGAPLVDIHGHALGTLCVIDYRPRALEAAQRALLESLARQVVLSMELRRVARVLATQTPRASFLNEFIAMCAWCKRVRDDDDRWHRVEELVTALAGGKVSHGMCPDCYGERRGRQKTP